MYHVPLALQCIYGHSDEGCENGDGEEGVRFQEEGRELRFPDSLYAGDLILCGELEEDLRVMVSYLVEVCRRGGLKFNTGKSKVRVLGGEKGLECEVCIDGIHLEHILEFKYLGCVLDKSGTDEAECSRRW